MQSLLLLLLYLQIFLVHGVIEIFVKNIVQTLLLFICYFTQIAIEYSLTVFFLFTLNKFTLPGQS